MNKIILGVILAALVATTTTAFAEPTAATGKVYSYHADSRPHVALDLNRGPCIQLDPPISTVPAASGWACLDTTSLLYKEMDSLLLNANMWGKTCTIAWSETFIHGNPKIYELQCYSSR